MDAPGALIDGKYELLEVAGSGGMATVWRATQRGAAGFQRTVAIKRIKEDVAMDPKFRDMFVEEASPADGDTYVVKSALATAGEVRQLVESLRENLPEAKVVLVKREDPTDIFVSHQVALRSDRYHSFDGKKLDVSLQGVRAGPGADF